MVPPIDARADENMADTDDEPEEEARLHPKPDEGGYNDVNEPFLFDVTPAAMTVPMNGSLEVTVKPSEKEMKPQQYMIGVNSYLFEIQEPRASKGCISQLYGVFNAGEEVKFKVRLRDKDKSAPELNSNTAARGELTIQHLAADVEDDSKLYWEWRFKKSKVLWQIQNHGFTAATFQIELHPEDSSNEEVKRRMDQFEKDELLFKERQEAKNTRKREEKKQKTIDKTDDKTQGKTEEEKEKKKDVVEPPKVPEKEAFKPSKSPVKPEKPSSKKEEPKKREKSEKKSEKKSVVKETKPNPNRSVMQNSKYPNSEYENLGPNLNVPEGVKPSVESAKTNGKTSVVVDKKKQKPKKKSKCCAIL